MTDEEIIEITDTLNANNKTMKEHGISDNLWGKAVECIEFLQSENAELRARLDKALQPKFSKGDKAYALIDTFFYTAVYPVEIKSADIVYEVFDGEEITTQHRTRIFTDKTQAEARLAELKGEKDENL